MKKKKKKKENVMYIILMYPNSCNDCPIMKDFDIFFSTIYGIKESYFYAYISRNLLRLSFPTDN